MTLSQKALQRKRDKKNAKRRGARPAGSVTTPPGRARQWQLAAAEPIHEVLVSANLFETGMGALCIARRIPDGRIAVATFLLDTYCLGVKNAMNGILDESAYEDLVNKLMASTQSVARVVEPAYGRKLIEEMVAWSRSLGFSPHPDYPMAAQILGDIETTEDIPSFSFGRDGKPFYISGPNESLAMSRRIADQLEKKCGTGGYDYLVQSGEPIIELK